MVDEGTGSPATPESNPDPGWHPVGVVPSAPAVGTPPSRFAGTPHVPAAPTRPQSTAVSMNVGILVLIVCGIALMVGSVGSWVQVSGSVSIASFHASFHSAINGIDPGISSAITVNGYLTFIGGVILLLFGGLAMTNDDLTLAIMTFIVAAITGILAIYDTFRIVQKISQVTTSTGSSLSVGAGLICVLSAALLAVVVSVVRLLSR
jgi:hypothetical protein